MQFATYYGQLLRATHRSAPTAQEARRDYQSLLSMRYTTF